MSGTWRSQDKTTRGSLGYLNAKLSVYLVKKKMKSRSHDGLRPIFTTLQSIFQLQAFVGRREQDVCVEIWTFNGHKFQ